MHARGLAEQDIERHVHRLVAEVVVLYHQLPVVGGHTEHRKRAALAFAQRTEFVEALGGDRQHITLLRLVAPDLARRHARFFGGNGTQVEMRAAARAMRQFRHGVGNAAGADIMNRQNRIQIVHLPATINHLLRATLDFGVATLHRSEVEISGIGTGRHARRRAAAEADQHARPTKLDQ